MKITFTSTRAFSLMKNFICKEWSLFAECEIFCEEEFTFLEWDPNHWGIFSGYEPGVSQEDMEGYSFWEASAIIKKDGSEIHVVTPTSGATWNIIKKEGKEDVVIYDGPFRGFGESIFIPKDLDYSKIFGEESRVSASGYEGSLTGYLKHRLAKHCRLEVLSNEDAFSILWGADVPHALKTQGYRFFVWQDEEPVEGFEKLWPGSPVRWAFLKEEPKTGRFHEGNVIEARWAHRALKEAYKRKTS